MSLLGPMMAYIRAFFLSRHRLALESVALRQQLAVFKRKQPRPRLNHLDRLFWVALRRWYSGWANALILVNPETVVSWHRAGFRLLWRWKSRPAGRPKVTAEVRLLIWRLKAENPGWGAPRIHGELLQLGFMVSEPTVSRYLKRLKGRQDDGKAQRWLAFLNNHREVIARLRLLHGSDADVSNTLLLLRHRTWPAMPSPFQLHGASHFRVDRTATKAGSAASLPLPVRPVRS